MVWDFVSLPLHPGQLWGPPSHLSNGYGGVLFPEVRPPEHEADHSPPASAKVKNVWICTSTPNTASWHGA